ncbi:MULTISPECIES: DUF4129 domain-containing protein [Brachybacterium]|uniref:DUF4129 domain-containing protein n=2 Tax=Brachybacterium TaxID=43668 RepID=A0A426SI11_9MICO|nr:MULTISPECIES: DUF4129 domain-containing protein [Brachybacterium]RRR17780.1 DUF4129 domain-containing protein [Brachybacterium paraconglomeratum]GLI30894.1 hypothetical protein BCONGLO52_17350 [Brachybacterium conglomeratum]GLK05789.1 hypothetical protein GCM10017597_25890 [Brachybacterium conglomeratum]
MIPAAPRLGPDEARERILEELAKDEYDDSPGFVAWLLGAIEDWLARMVDGVDGSSAMQTVIAVLLALVLAAVVVLVLRRTGLLRRSPALAVDAALDAEPVLSGEELRGAARDAIDAGRTDDGTVLALRALVRDLEERTLLDVATGMTAHEAATRAALTFPDLRGRLQRGADAFDTAAYSVRSVGGKPAEDMLRLAEYIAETSPDLSALEQAEAGTPA